MRIAVYHPWVYVKSGLERTLMELHRRSRHQWTIYTSHYDRAGTYPELAEMNVVELPRVSVRRRYGAVLGAARTIASTRIDLSGHDALVVSCDGLGSLLTFRNHDLPVVCLCFTPLRAVYDRAYRARHLGKLGVFKPAALAFEAGWRLVDRAAWRHYDHVFAISETVRARIAAGGLRRAEEVEVAYPGIDADRMRPSDVFEPFFFLPGRIMWTKNLELGIRAFQEFRARTGLPYELRIAGMVDDKSRPYLAQLQALAGGDPAIRFIQGPTDAGMADLYARCQAVLFTPFNEDWGLTPLEAAAHGKPVVAVNAGGATETVLHGETGFLEAPTPAAFSRAMEALARDPDRARAMGRRGVEQARRFTWSAFVARIDDHFTRLEQAGASLRAVG